MLPHERRTVGPADVGAVGIGGAFELPPHAIPPIVMAMSSHNERNAPVAPMRASGGLPEVSIVMFLNSPEKGARCNVIAVARHRDLNGRVRRAVGQHQDRASATRIFRP